MKAIYTLLILFSFSLSSLAQLNGEITQKYIPAPSLSNNLFRDRTTRPISIYLPPSYHHVDYAFPVVYFLAGAGYDVSKIQASPQSATLKEKTTESPGPDFKRVKQNGKEFWFNPKTKESILIK